MGGDVRLWDTSTGAPTGTLTVDGGAALVELDPTGQVTAIVTMAGVLQVWDA